MYFLDVDCQNIWTTMNDLNLIRGSIGYYNSNMHEHWHIFFKHLTLIHNMDAWGYFVSFWAFSLARVTEQCWSSNHHVSNFRLIFINICQPQQASDPLKRKRSSAINVSGNEANKTSNLKLRTYNYYNSKTLKTIFWKYISGRVFLTEL